MAHTEEDFNAVLDEYGEYMRVGSDNTKSFNERDRALKAAQAAATVAVAIATYLARPQP